MSPAPIKPTPAQLRALARRDPALGREIKRLESYPGFPQAGDCKPAVLALARSLRPSGRSTAAVLPTPSPYAGLKDGGCLGFDVLVGWNV